MASLGKYNPEGDKLCQGMNCHVRVDMNDPLGSNPVVIGFVESASFRANFNINRAEVIGEFLPASVDMTSVSVSVSLDGFVPTKQLVENGIESTTGGGTLNMKSFNPDVAKMVDTHLATKIPYFDLYDYKHEAVIGATSWVVPSSYSDSAQGKGYIKANVTFEGIGYDNGADYESAV